MGVLDLNRGVRTASLALIAVLLAVSRADGDTDWDGSTDTDWFTSSNWTSGIPDSSDNVLIPSGLSNYPVLDANGAVCRDLTIQDGATLDLVTYRLDVHQDLDAQDTDVVLSTSSGEFCFVGGQDTDVLSPFVFSGDFRIDKDSGFETTLLAEVTVNDIYVDFEQFEAGDAASVLTQTITGNVVVDANGCFDREDAIVNIAGDVSFAGEYDDDKTDGGTYVGGDWTDTGVMRIGTKTVTFNGGGTSTITVPDSSDFYNITITNSTTATVASSIDINGTVTINAGSVFDCNGDLDAAIGVTCVGSGRLQLGSSVTTLGTFTAGSGTVEYDDTSTNRTMQNVTYHHLEIDASSRTVTTGASETLGGTLDVTSGTFAIGTNTVTVPGATDVNGTVTLSSGTLDANGSFDATGGSVTFTGSGELRLGGAVTSLGTLTASTGTVEYDATAVDVSVDDVTYYNLEIDTSSRKATTAGDVTATNDLTIASGELEVDDADTLQVDGTTSITGTLDLEPGSVLQLANGQSLTVNSGGTFEAIGTATDLALVTSTGANRYAFSVSAGGILRVNYGYFRHMDVNGIQVTDNGAVQALAQLDNTVFSDGTTGGKFLKVTDNDNAVTLVSLLFDQSPAGISTNVETVSATATITIDPYGGDFGGEANENDNLSGTVTPGFIDWAMATPVQLRRFDATSVAGGVLLEWETAAEWRTLGFHLERLEIGATAVGPSVVLEPAVRATGASPSGDSYSHLDDSAQPGRSYVYRLVEIDARGGRRVLAKAEMTTSRAATTAARRPASASLSNRRAARTRSTTSRGTTSAAASSFPAPVTSVRILVDRPGVIRVSHSQLAAAGFAVDAEPQRFRLRRDELDWPLEIIGDDDRSFDSGDSIDFVATPFHSLETRFDVYWLDLARPGVPVSRIQRYDDTPTAAAIDVGESRFENHWQPDELYVASIENGEGRDHWFWDSLMSGTTLDVPLEIDALSLDGAEGVEIDVVLEGWTDDPLTPLDHYIEVSLNGDPIGVLTSNGRGPYMETFEVSARVLFEGSNALSLEAVTLGGNSLSFLDRISVRYPRKHRARNGRLSFELETTAPQLLENFDSPDVVLYQVSGAGAPRRIVGGLATPVVDGWTLSFWLPFGEPGQFEAFTNSGAQPPAAVVPVVSETYADPIGGADYVVIVARTLVSSVQPLVDLRRSLGFGVAVIELEAIYDKFDGGRRTSTAVHRFLDHAYTSWPAPALEYVLLVGDATYDPRGNLGPSPRQLLPTRLVETPQFQTASDNWFGDLVAGDGAPELCIGRLPVATPEECEQVVQKILRYESRAQGSRDIERAILITDVDSPFSVVNDALELSLSSRYRVVPIDLASPTLIDPKETVYQEWRDGAAVVHYSGHGSRQSWNQSDVVHVDEIPPVANGRRLPVVVAMNCLNGYFQHTSSPSLGEALVLLPGGGVAYWGPSAVTTHLRQENLAQRFYHHLFAPESTTLGRAIREAKSDLSSDPANRGLLDTWILLGDPGLTAP